MKKNHMWLIVILLVSLSLRLIALNQSLWLDEAIEWWGVTAFNLKELLTGYMLGDFNPPGHHLLMWFWVRVFGDSEVSLRFPSVILGVGTVWLIWRIEIEIEKRQKASRLKRSDLDVRQGQTFPYATLLAATNGLLIYYSQEARMYAMATFFVTASIWAFLKLQNFFSIQMLTTYYLLLTAALYSHYLIWLMIPLFVIGGLRSFRGIRKIWSVTPVISTVPLWPLLVNQLQNGIASAGNSQWATLSQTTPKNIALVFVKFVTGRIPFPDGVLWQLIVGAAVLVFWVVVVRGMREMWGVREQRIIVYWLVVPLVLGGLIGLFVPVFSYFRFVFVLPAALILFARGVLMGDTRAIGIMGGMGVVVFLLFSLLYLLIPSNNRENWRELTQFLHQQEKSPVVVIFGAVRPPFDYYDRLRSSVYPAELLLFRGKFQETMKQRRDFQATVEARRDSFWVIPYGKDIFDPEGTLPRFLRAYGYYRVFERHFRGTTLEQWEF